MMSDQRRELDVLRFQYDKQRSDWEQRERRYVNQIEELERKLASARDELAAEVDAHAATARALLAEHRRKS